MEQEAFQPRTDLQQVAEAVQNIKNEIGKVIVGQSGMIELLIAAVLSDGHVLIEGVPGVAKTLTAKLTARCMDVAFSRIQFTPDLMPSDLLGTSVFNPKTTEFQFRQGPVFSNIVLIDEINRSPAKTQAALFEAMEEKQITIDGHTYRMAEPFMVIATQNPIEHEGTYRLPEAQLDRFLFKVAVPYPSLEEEVQILTMANEGRTLHYEDIVKPLLKAEHIIHARKQIEQLHVEARVLEYIAQLVQATRQDPGIYLGASPRASVAVLRASKAIAAMNGRDFVTPDDIHRVLPAVLCHRLILTPEREMEGVTVETIIDQLVKKTEVPR